MSSHMSVASAAIKRIVRRKRLSGKSMVRKAKTHASKKLKGASNAMLKAAANHLANHPTSKKAQKIVKHLVKQ